MQFNIQTIKLCRVKTLKLKLILKLKKELNLKLKLGAEFEVTWDMKLAFKLEPETQLEFNRNWKRNSKLDLLQQKRNSKLELKARELNKLVYSGGAYVFWHLNWGSVPQNSLISLPIPKASELKWIHFNWNELPWIGSKRLQYELAWTVSKWIEFELAWTESKWIE